MASNFPGSPVLIGEHVAMAVPVLDYNLDEAAFELAQISKGCVRKM